MTFRFFYSCFLSVLPLTALFLSSHLLVENSKTVHILLIWILSALFSLPTALPADILHLEEDPAWRPLNSTVCTNNNLLHLAWSLTTFLLPTLLLLITWLFLLLQSAGFCSRRPQLRSADLSLSLITLLLIPLFVVSRGPIELFNLQLFLANFSSVEIFSFGEFYRAVMKWAVFAPAMLHPLLYFTLRSDTANQLEMDNTGDREELVMTNIAGDPHNREELVMTNIAGDPLNREEYCQLVCLGLSRSGLVARLRMMAEWMFDSWARPRTSSLMWSREKLRTVTETMDLIQDMTENRDIVDNMKRLKVELAPAEVPHIERWTVAMTDCVHQDCVTGPCHLHNGGLRLIEDCIPQVRFIHY